jgi:gluconolactonase
MKIYPAIGCLLLVIPVGGAEKPALPARLDPYAVVANISFAEGPAFDSHGNLFFPNYRENGTVGRMTPEGEVAVWMAPADFGLARRPFIFGLKADAHDNLIGADYGGRWLLKISPEKKVTVLADSFENRPLNGPNDLCIDRAGSIYFTDPPKEKDDAAAIYRHSARGALARIKAGGIGCPNGIALSGDERTLYVSDTWTNRIVAFDVAADGSLGEARVIYHFETPSVDGIGVDEFGRIWVARLGNKTLDVVSPDGKLLASYAMGGDRVTNLAWRGKQLFVTIAGEHSIVRVEAGCAGAR